MKYMSDRSKKSTHDEKILSFCAHFTSNKHKGRLGVFKTQHGSFETPAFYCCATKASLKSLSVQDIEKAQTPILLSNTYHLFLSPGADLIEAQGGLHKWMNWNKPLFTDSGGFQIFSLGHGSVADEIKGRSGKSEPKKSQPKMNFFYSLQSIYKQVKKLDLKADRAINIEEQNKKLHFLKVLYDVSEESKSLNLMEEICGQDTKIHPLFDLSVQYTQEILQKSFVYSKKPRIFSDILILSICL